MHTSIHRLVRTMYSSFTPRNAKHKSQHLYWQRWYLTRARECSCLLPLPFSLPAFPSLEMDSSLQRGARQAARKHPALWCAPRDSISTSPGMPCLANTSQLSLGGDIAAGGVVCERKSTVHDKLRSSLFLGFSAESMGKGASHGGDVCCVDRCHPGKSFIVEVFTSSFVLSEHLHSWEISSKLGIAQGLHLETPARTDYLQRFQFSLCWYVAVSSEVPPGFWYDCTQLEYFRISKDIPNKECLIFSSVII